MFELGTVGGQCQIEARSYSSRGGGAATGRGRNYMHIGIEICVLNWCARIPNRRYTIPCVRTRGGWGVCKRRSEAVSVRGQCTAQETAEENDDGKPGWYQCTRHVFGVSSWVVLVPCCYGSSGVCTRVRGRGGCWTGLVSRIGGGRGCTTSVDCCDAFGHSVCAILGRRA